jgi:hypothetical protein
MERELTAMDRRAERRQRTLSKTGPLRRPFKTPRLAQTENRNMLVADKQDTAKDQDQAEDEDSQQETHQGVAWVTPQVFEQMYPKLHQDQHQDNNKDKANHTDSDRETELRQLCEDFESEIYQNKNKDKDKDNDNDKEKIDEDISGGDSDDNVPISQTLKKRVVMPRVFVPETEPSDMNDAELTMTKAVSLGKCDRKKRCKKIRPRRICRHSREL